MIRRRPALRKHLNLPAGSLRHAGKHVHKILARDVA
jgi:hypothetical protein